MIKTTLERLNAYYIDYRRLFGFKPAGLATPAVGKKAIFEYNTLPISDYSEVIIEEAE